MQIEDVAKLDHNDFRKGVLGVIGLFGFDCFVERRRLEVLLLLQQPSERLEQKLESHVAMICVDKRALKRGWLNRSRRFPVAAKNPKHLFMAPRDLLSGCEEA